MRVSKGYTWRVHSTVPRQEIPPLLVLCVLLLRSGLLLPNSAHTRWKATHHTSSRSSCVSDAYVPDAYVSDAYVSDAFVSDALVSDAR